eukprot:1184865-Prorocentrum_minimum.AAC.4
MGSEKETAERSTQRLPHDPPPLPPQPCFGLPAGLRARCRPVPLGALWQQPRAPPLRRGRSEWCAHWLTGCCLHPLGPLRLGDTYTALAGGRAGGLSPWASDTGCFGRRTLCPGCFPRLLGPLLYQPSPLRRGRFGRRALCSGYSLPPHGPLL